MQYHTIVVTAEDPVKCIVVDDFQPIFQIGLQCKELVAGDYTVAYTLDDPYASGFDPATATYFPVTGFDDISIDAGGQLTIPCRASILIGDGTSSWELRAVQAGPV